MGMMGLQTPEGAWPRHGTCAQTGNDAARYPWRNTPLGRAMVIWSLVLAWHLKYSDERMSRRQLPTKKEMQPYVDKILPWFAKHYDDWRAQRAIERPQGSPMIPFSASDLRGRLYHMFHTDHAHEYGMNHRHPLHCAQDPATNPKSIRSVLIRAGEQMEASIARLEPLTMEQMEEWGR